MLILPRIQLGAGKQLEEDHTQREDIGLYAIALAVDDLRRAVCRRAHGLCERCAVLLTILSTSAALALLLAALALLLAALARLLRHARLRTDHLGKREVGQHRRALCVEQDVVRLDVAVNDAVFVHEGERMQRECGHLDLVLVGQLLCRDGVGQVTSHFGQHEREVSLVHARDVHHGHDVRVGTIQKAQHGNLAKNATVNPRT